MFAAAFEKSRGYAVEKNHYVTALHQIAAEKYEVEVVGAYFLP